MESVHDLKGEVRELLNVDTVSSLLSHGGALSDESDFFEERQTQIELAKSVAHSFNADGLGVFEAGTGVGKSFAYLLPAMLFANKNNERVVISTGTINLQQQLYEKDIPIAKKILKKDIKTVLIKGRQNFICLRRLSDVLDEKDLFSDENEELEKLYEWSKVSNTGSRSDLLFMPRENIWQRINSESDGCMGMRCPFFSRCFVMKLRKEASEATVLIVNHHLLFADIEMRLSAGYDDVAVLPPYKRLIFDEAHGMEHAATSFFSERISRFKFIKQMNLMYRVRGGSIAGNLFTLESLSSYAEGVQSIVHNMQKIKKDLEVMEENALLLLGNGWTWRLCNESAYLADELLSSLKVLHADIAEYTGVIRSVIEGIAEEDAQSTVVWESKLILRRLESAGMLCNNFCTWEERADTVFWIEKRQLPSSYATKQKKKRFLFYPQLVQTPLDLAPLMNKGVYEPLRTVVCTSATLQIANSFSYWKSRCGMFMAEKKRVLEGVFDSPFPYDQNLLLCVPSDAPFPNDSSFQEYVEKTLVQLIEAAKGRTLVLFTSYDSLSAAYKSCATHFARDGIRLYKQGEDDRFRLLEDFKRDESSVLFATDSFWEGVDVPGTSLVQVILVKLPFAVPSDPVYAARSEAIEKRGGSAFMELSVPSAVIKFRQGFGRLMRRSTDYGCVVALDKRLIQKQYGKLFLRSLPQSRHCFDVTAKVVCSVKQFLK